ncbi:MAG: STAS domain-containing protein [Myxococcales bacterium]|nr:STAS domain-containing protein [Myxococcales bacterium]TDJ15034.1 MAG: anti-sigma factor antagonist [Deltaproteobacteria bacterium]
MEHSIREEGGALIVSFEGDVDLEQSPKAREVLLECVKRGNKILVDLSGVSYIDSSGVASLVEAFQVAKKQGKGFALVSVNAAALRVLQLARLDKVFTIHETLADAL